MKPNTARTDTNIRTKTSIPRDKWIPSKLWNRILRVMPIPCADIIFQRKDNAILYGWRLITPYKDAWALPGGHILHRENLKQCAGRIARQYGLRFNGLHLVGVFPVNFPNRSDISITLAALEASGEPRKDGFEFSKFSWRQSPPRLTGTNYVRMVNKWRAASRSSSFLKLSELQPRLL